MLILTRHPGQSLSIHPHPTLDPGTPVELVFADGPIRVQVLRVQGPQVRLGVAAPAGLCILREELRPVAAVSPLSGEARRRLARKLKVLMFLNLHSTQSLAAAAGLAPDRVRAAESGVGALVLDDLDKDRAGVGGEGVGPVPLAGADGGGAGDLGVVGGGGV